MLSIDREASQPVYEQLLDQLRYQLAAGAYSVGDRLPSTRALGRQLGLSFHTVRKAYQQLEKEGLLTSKVGSGYHVNEPPKTGKADRLEKGAGLVQEFLQRLIGLGLKEQEIEGLVQEQLAFLEGPGQRQKVVFVAPYREMAETCAKQIEEHLRRPVEGVPFGQIHGHPDTDQAITPYRFARNVLSVISDADVIGVQVRIHEGVLDAVSRLLPSETIAIATRYPDAVEPIMTELRQATGFAGQMLNLPYDLKSSDLAPLLRGVSLLLYTPQVKRRLSSTLKTISSQDIGPAVSLESLTQLRERMS
ncbi:MAG: GntR family transcriptional regulator [Bacteroidota bacterium]